MRVVLQTDPTTVTSAATMESENFADENLQFLNLDPSFVEVNPVANSTPGGNEVIRMNTSYTVGPARSFKVFPGDKVDASVMAYYNSGSGLTHATAASLAGEIATVLAGGSTIVDGIVQDIYEGDYSGTAVSPFQGSTKPSAFLNYILFDANYVPIAAQSQPLGGTAGVVHEVAFPEPITVEELGYLFACPSAVPLYLFSGRRRVYLSYDNTTDATVYFDDLKIIYTESPVIQVNAYYPFGLPSYSWVRDGEEENNYLYQGKELDTLAGWQDFGSRVYYAELGRWFSSDPAGQFASPYMGMGNVPMVGVDPNGEFVWFIPVIVGAIAGGYAGASIQSGTLNPGQWDSDWWKGAIAGAVVGGAIGAALAPSLGASGITVGGVGTPHTISWSLTSSALNSGAVNSTFDMVNGGEAWRGALSGLLTSLAGQGLAAAGTLLLAKGEGLGAGFAKLGYEAFSTTTVSALGNLASGQNWDENLNVGVGPFTLPFKDGELTWSSLGNLNNLLTAASNVHGLVAASVGLAHIRGDKSNLAWYFEDISGDEFKKTYKGNGSPYPEDKPIYNKLTKWGAPAGTIHGTIYAKNNVSQSVLLHEKVHMLFTRFSGGAYLDWLFGDVYPSSTLTGILSEKISGVPHRWK